MNASTRLADLRGRLQEQATPRALMGLGALGAIVAFVAISDLAAAVSQKRERVSDLRRDALVQEALLDGENWSDRADAAEAQRRIVRTRFWRGETEGIVSARLQGAAETAAREAGVERPRVSVSETSDALGADAVLFEIELQGVDRTGQFLALFQTLSRTEAVLAPSALQWNRRNGRLSLNLAAPAVVAEPTEEPAP